MTSLNFILKWILINWCNLENCECQKVPPQQNFCNNKYQKKENLTFHYKASSFNFTHLPFSSPDPITFPMTAARLPRSWGSPWPLKRRTSRTSWGLDLVSSSDSLDDSGSILAKNASGWSRTTWAMHDRASDLMLTRTLESDSISPGFPDNKNEHMRRAQCTRGIPEQVTESIWKLRWTSCRTSSEDIEPILIMSSSFCCPSSASALLPSFWQTISPVSLESWDSFKAVPTSCPSTIWPGSDSDWISCLFSKSPCIDEDKNKSPSSTSLTPSTPLATLSPCKRKWSSSGDRNISSAVLCSPSKSFATELPIPVSTVLTVLSAMEAVSLSSTTESPSDAISSKMSKPMEWKETTKNDIYQFCNQTDYPSSTLVHVWSSSWVVSQGEKSSRSSRLLFSYRLRQPVQASVAIRVRGIVPSIFILFFCSPIILVSGKVQGLLSRAVSYHSQSLYVINVLSYFYRLTNLIL